MKQTTPTGNVINLETVYILDSGLRERSRRVFDPAFSARSAATNLKIGVESIADLISLAFRPNI